MSVVSRRGEASVDLGGIVVQPDHVDDRLEDIVDLLEHIEGPDHTVGPGRTVVEPLCVNMMMMMRRRRRQSKRDF